MFCCVVSCASWCCGSVLVSVCATRLFCPLSNADPLQSLLFGPDLLPSAPIRGQKSALIAFHEAARNYSGRPCTFLACLANLVRADDPFATSQGGSCGFGPFTLGSVSFVENRDHGVPPLKLVL